MWAEDGKPTRVRFLPAAWLPRPLLDQLQTAMEQLSSLLSAGETLGAEPHALRAAAVIRGVRRELARHSGPADEPCLLTKEVVFDLSDQLGVAAGLLAGVGLHAAALVASAVDDRLLEQLVETQPMAPA
ncbi:MAG: hypothetical protein ACYDGN_17760 [Acidimicrobiales bacterium]